MTTRIDIDGLEKLLQRLDPERAQKILDSLITRATALVLAETKKPGPRGPRPRPIRMGGRVFRDMTIGEYTPVMTGNLRRSITSRVELTRQRGIVGTNVVYAKWVHRRKPFLEWALARAQEPIRDEIDKAGQKIVGDR